MSRQSHSLFFARPKRRLQTEFERLPMHHSVSAIRTVLLTGMAAATLYACSLPSPTAWLGSDDATKNKDSEFPNLSEVPKRPEGLGSQSERRELAQELASDAQNAKHTAETLRGDGQAPSFAPDRGPSLPAERSTSDEKPSDQRSTLSMPRDNRISASEPPFQPAVPVDIGTDAADNSFATAIGPAKEEKAPSLLTSVYQSKLSASAIGEEAVEDGKVSFAEPRTGDVSALLSSPSLIVGADQTELLIVGVSSRSRNDIFQERMMSSAVITNRPDPTSPIFAKSTSPRMIEGQGQKLVDLRGRGAISRRGNRRYTATILENRGLLPSRIDQVNRTDMPRLSATNRTEHKEAVEKDSRDDPGESIRPPDAVLFFAQGDADIEAADEPDLARIARVQQQRGGAVRVVTHIPSRSRNDNRKDRWSLEDSLKRTRVISQRIMKLGVHPMAVVIKTRFDEDDGPGQVAQNDRSNLRVEVFLE